MRVFQSGVDFFKGVKPNNAWIWWALFTALLISLPLWVVFSNIAAEADQVWIHIRTRLLPGYLINTIVLLIGVAVLTFIMGLSTAWLVSMYQFPGRNFFAWALILPLSIPAYILGFTWAGILDYTSPVYVFFRSSLGIDTGQYLFVDLLSVPGAIIIFSLALYPYVFLITRAWFTKQSSSLFEAAASLGKKPGGIFFQVALPLARPALVAGISLALMEVLNDYGLVRYFGVDTFTTGIFTAWFSFSNPQAALKLSAWLMIFVLMLLSLEKFQRRKMRFSISGGNYRPVKIHHLTSWGAFIALCICSVPFVFGFLIPASMLVYWSWITAPMVVNFRFWELLSNSFLLATIASVVVIVFAVIIAYAVRSFPTSFMKFLARAATLGYALPGAVVAIGILVPFLWIDGYLAQLSGPGIRIAVTGTWFALIYAYLVRFMAVGYNSIESGMEKVSKSLDDASRSLGRSNLKTLNLVTLPLIKTSVISAALLVFIDVLKELPLTLILRPFNFDTLAIRAFEFASDERVAEAAPAALIIIITGLVPVLFLNKFIDGGKR
jgi:iron(III) transport system permease protein